ncbi:hypothetical protein HGRIS_000538 [Hohenbuehelia grisea]|uniref:Uncharacterized protein n=1 Tax=Hohenbuehelia grisea TaxID=104357 RepID=A0ABR3JTD4_9AGAR
MYEYNTVWNEREIQENALDLKDLKDVNGTEKNIQSRRGEDDEVREDISQAQKAGTKAERTEGLDRQRIRTKMNDKTESFTKVTDSE